jgi:DOPA 4,5-dioxygenase
MIENDIPSYHAHIYFRSPDERARAEILREQIGAKFLVRLGRWHDAPVGPHTDPMFQVAFLKDIFSAFIPWLMLNRAGLAILLHPNTGRPHDDHVINPFWFGEILPIKDETLPEISDEPLEMEPNTQPLK